jgi:small subunit ribosomal protein S18
MIKNIKKKDISWKNVPLLIKFVNEVGQIMNKYQTRLPTPIQRKVAKTIKHARNMGLLPFCNYIKPQDKLPLTSVLTNFYESTVKVVDKQTGRINIMNNPLEKEQFVYSSFDINEAKENLVNE